MNDMKCKNSLITILLSLSSLLILPAEGKRPNAVNVNKIAKKEQYAGSIPKRTLSEVAYGSHERNVLDFWKAKSEKPTPLAFVIHGGGGKMGAKKGLIALSMHLPC
jgi:hypothetical protein